MSENGKISYAEFAATNLPATKQFFQSVFDWSFKDYGPEYMSFSNQGLDGGFYQSNLCSSTEKGSVLIVLYSDNIEATQAKIEQFGGKIVKPIFSFPGGRRFHFCEPSGNELAVWSDVGVE